MTTGLVFHELYLWHNTWNFAQVFPPGLTVQPGEHAENPETKRRFKNLLEVSGLVDHLKLLKPRPATEDELARCHGRAHIANIKSISDAGYGDASQLTPLGKGSFEIAALAAGGAIVAAEAVVTGAVKNAYALVRPPGHHASVNTGMGFCLFGNAAVAIRHVQQVHGIGRVATVDWDVHHGNGTQAIFYEDPSVLTISLHQENLFPPNSGSCDQRGKGAGIGANLNIPLPPGCGPAAYVEVFEKVVTPALERFRPEMIVVPCGFDASGVDPLGRMMMTSLGYRDLARRIMALAERLCDGRLLMTHEGGYSATHVPYCGLAVLEELSGISTGIEDPWLPLMQAWGQMDLQPHQAAAVARAVPLVDEIPTG